jgi:hypothetical protein
MKTCINCEHTEEQTPLLVMQFRGESVYICPACLPVLIHKPEKLAEKLPGMQPGEAPKHEH